MNPGQAKWNAAKANAQCVPKNPALLNCKKTQPEISVNWRAHDFGRIRKGSTPPVHDLIITSIGTKDLASIKVTLTGDQFKIDNPGGFAATLAPGATTTVKVKFQPTSYGQKNGKLRISSNAVNENPIDVTVTGKQFSVITFVVEEEPTGAKIESVKLKVKQTGQPEQEITTDANGKVELETEKDGKFEVKLGDHNLVLEFRSLTTA
ncbi:MAG TPA: choice-of-anchor D domain-containing protein [Bryobacteraceae bacterium]|nr:choice-of-anchor D domain-containing protein [Bryobacteraceae bacterium]